MGGPTKVMPITGSVTDEGPARRLLDCDLVVGCTDNQWSHTVMNAIAYQYYIPVLDLGVELQAGGAMGGRVSWLTPGSACLWCCKVLDPQRVRAEQLPRATLHDEISRGYVAGLDAPAPAVVSINGVVASLAVTEILGPIHSVHRTGGALQLAYVPARRGGRPARLDHPEANMSNVQYHWAAWVGRSR